MKLISPDFASGGFIPKKFTCQGDNINPNLIIEDVPKGAISLALILDDPDAPIGTFNHWLLWNIDPKNTVIKENSTPLNSIVGQNSAGTNQYVGPCPPSNTHRYFFHLYALDTKVFLPDSSTKDDLLAQLGSHTLAQAELMTNFSH